jgi:hypothetical protein
MLLQARMLTDVQSVNSFRYSPQNQVQWTVGDTLYVYFQLIDASLDRSMEGFNPAGRRYVPASGATLSVVIGSLDLAKQVTRAASQPYFQDPSIWRVSILATDTIKGTSPLKLTLTEGTKVTTGQTQNALLIWPGN